MTNFDFKKLVDADYLLKTRDNDNVIVIDARGGMLEEGSLMYDKATVVDWTDISLLGEFGGEELGKLLSKDNYREIFNILDKLHQDQYGAPLTEGRVTTVETEYFYLVTVYTPNSKNDLSRLGLRHDLWDPLFLHYLQFLEQTKPVVFCGDLNVSHQEIDLARPKQNTKNAGFTKDERAGIENYIQNHFLDTFRILHPNDIKYSWWSHWGHARENNVGWRIDYFFISEQLKNNLTSAKIHDQISGSDHCPISITLDF